MQGRREHNQSRIEFPVGPLCRLLKSRCEVRLASGPRRTLRDDNHRIMRNYKHLLDALEKLDLEWEGGVRDLYRTGWRQ